MGGKGGGKGKGGEDLVGDGEGMVRDGIRGGRMVLGGEEVGEEGGDDELGEGRRLVRRGGGVDELGEEGWKWKWKWSGSERVSGVWKSCSLIADLQWIVVSGCISFSI